MIRFFFVRGTSVDWRWKPLSQDHMNVLQDDRLTLCGYITCMSVQQDKKTMAQDPALQATPTQQIPRALASKESIYPEHPINPTSFPNPIYHNAQFSTGTQPANQPVMPNPAPCTLSQKDRKDSATIPAHGARGPVVVVVVVAVATDEFCAVDARHVGRIGGGILAVPT